MQITLTIPDELAVQAQAQGLSLEAYVEQLLEQARLGGARSAAPARTREQIEAFFNAIAEGSERLPPLATASFARESFYEDRR